MGVLYSSDTQTMNAMNPFLCSFVRYELDTSLAHITLSSLRPETLTRTRGVKEQCPRTGVN